MFKEKGVLLLGCFRVGVFKSFGIKELSSSRVRMYKS